MSRITRETLARADRGDISIGLAPLNLAREARGERDIEHGLRS